jgi:hypothetical protein
VTIAEMVGLIELGTAIDARRRSAPPATGPCPDTLTSVNSLSPPAATETSGEGCPDTYIWGRTVVKPHNDA